MRFALQAGLMLRHGQRTLELVRELDGNEYLLEDVITRRPSIIKRSVLITRIFEQQYRVITGSPPTLGADMQQWPAVVDLSALKERERRLLDFRLAYVKALDRLHVTRGQRKKIATAIEKTAIVRGDKTGEIPSTSAVMLWARKYQLSGGNPLALVDKHRIRKRATRTNETLERILWRVLRRSYFTRERHTLRHAYDQLRIELKRAREQGTIGQDVDDVSYPTLARRVQSVDLYQRIATREGGARARMECRTAFPDGVAQYPYQRVEIDHTPLNWVVICDRTGLPLGRPTLTVMIDSYSGYVLGFYISFYGPGLTSVVGLVRNALRPKDDIVEGLGLSHDWLSYGLGDEWVIDNGLEFHSFGFKNIAMALGVDVMYCRVRTPWLKPHVERFFGTLNTLTLVRGRITKTVANVMRIDPYKDAAITFGDLVKGLITFVVDVHPHEPNWRKMSTPYELFRDGLERCPPAEFPGDLQQLKLASAMSKRLTLGAGGIESVGLPYGCYDFKDIVNKHGSGLKLLCKWDPDDISAMYMQNPDGLRWHIAQCRWPEYAKGLSYNQHRLIRKFSAIDLRGTPRVESLLAARQRLHEHWMDATTARSRSDALLAGRYADLTSHKILAQPSDVDHLTSVAAPTRLVAPEEIVISERDIPTYDSFSF